MVDKNMLIGAFATGLTQAGLEGYWNYMAAQGKAPAGQFPYISLSEYIPPLDVWISCAGIPAALYAIGKLMRKDTAVKMAKGGAIYGTGTLIGVTTVRLTRKAAPTAQYVLAR